MYLHVYCNVTVSLLEIPLRPYKEAGERTKQNMRAKAIDVIQDCANKFVHFNANDIPEYENDLVSSKKWKSIFGISCESTSSEDSFLSNLAAEYKCYKDKEVNKAIRLQVEKAEAESINCTNIGGQSRFFKWGNIGSVQIAGCCSQRP